MKFENNNKELVDRIFNHPNIKAARSSSRTYASTIRRVANEFAGGYNKDLKWIKQPLLLQKIQKHTGSLNVKRNLVNAVIIAFKLEPNDKISAKFHKYLLELNKQVDERNKSGVLSDKMKNKTVPWAQVVKLRKLLGKKLRLSQAMGRKTIGSRALKIVNEYVILCCYTMTPPVRLDWSTVTFHNKKGFANIKEKTGNYLVLKKSTVTVYWNAYKTSKTHGSVSTELPKDLARILRRHCKFMKTHFPDNANLFLNARFEPMSRQNLGKLLENLFYAYFKKRISVSSLRRMYLSSKYSHKVIQEAREDARKMLHNVSVAQDNYVKKVND